MKSNSPRTLGELSGVLGCHLEGNPDLVIDGAAPIETAGTGDISFVANPRYRKFITSTNASALVLDLSMESEGRPSLRHERPYLTFARVVDILYAPNPNQESGIHATAQVATSASIALSAQIGPHCVVGADAKIGERVKLGANVTIAENVEIGDDTIVYAGVRIMDRSVIGTKCILHPNCVIGSDGFGFAESPQGLHKIKQIGHVEIGNSVEIGANTTVDRGALGATKIGDGTKIDNLVQIGHNVVIGKHCIIVAQAGISGSTVLGNGVVIAGQVGIIGHLEIGDMVRVGAQSGVANSIPAGKTYFGSPAREGMLGKRIEASLSRLPELFKRVRALEEGTKREE